MGSYDYYPSYVRVGDRKKKAAKLIVKLRKKRGDIEPIEVKGRNLTRTWWGKSWSKNLERYADYENRLERGRSYVRHGSVVDLKITPKEVTALVQGSGSIPYKVKVSITSIKKKIWQDMIQACEGQLESVQSLLQGNFPKELESILTGSGTGLFPTPRQIDFNCSCPDSVYMCKHVAASLYGVAVRLDNKPELLFVLRGVKMEELVESAVRSQTQKFVKASKKKSSRVLQSSEDLSSVFGLELDENIGVDKGKKELLKRSRKKTKATKKTVRKKKVLPIN